MENRIIKFRVWDKKYKKWTENISIRNSLVCEFDEEYNKKYLIIQQYTGLKDKNGKEIYEGDVVENVNFIGVVEYDNQATCFYLREVKAKIPLISDRIDTFSERIMGAIYWDTVIGNIFENPELLK